MWSLGASHGDHKLLSQITEKWFVTEGHGHLDLTCAQQEACCFFFKKMYFSCFKLHVHIICFRNVHKDEGQTPEVRASGSCEPTSVGAGPEASARAVEALSY